MYVCHWCCANLLLQWKLYARLIPSAVDHNMCLISLSLSSLSLISSLSLSLCLPSVLCWLFYLFAAAANSYHHYHYSTISLPQHNCRVCLYGSGHQTSYSCCLSIRHARTVRYSNTISTTGQTLSIISFTTHLSHSPLYHSLLISLTLHYITHYSSLSLSIISLTTHLSHSPLYHSLLISLTLHYIVHYSSLSLSSSILRLHQ